MTVKSLIYVLHGSWHGPAFFDPVKAKLEGRGYTVVCPQQPSTGATPPTKTMYDDVEFVRGELEHLADQGHDILLVMHSYGGVVGTQAAAGLGKTERQKKGQEGGIVRLFYTCAFILPVGHHLCNAVGGQLAPFIKAEDDGSCHVMNPEQVFYQDLPVDQQAHWASQLKPQTTICQFNPVTRIAYKDIPVSYLYCENDQALPLPVQKQMVKKCGVKVQEFTCTAGHSPFLSQPETFVDYIVTASETIESR
ncbi:hypothetical protein ABEF95_008073 [Exophiala dermatitidis]